MARKLKNQVKDELEGKIDQLEHLIEETERAKSRISSEYDKAGLEAARQVLEEAQQDPPPPPKMEHVSMIDLQQRGEAVLQPIRNQVMDEEREKQNRSQENITKRLSGDSPGISLTLPLVSGSQNQPTSTFLNVSAPVRFPPKPRPSQSQTTTAQTMLVPGISQGLSAPPRQFLMSLTQRNPSDQKEGQAKCHAAQAKIRNDFISRVQRGQGNEPVVTMTTTTLTTTTTTNTQANHQQYFYQHQPPADTVGNPNSTSSPVTTGYQLNPGASPFDPRYQGPGASPFDPRYHGPGASPFDPRYQEQDGRFAWMRPQGTMQEQNSFNSVQKQEEMTQLLVEAVRQNRLPVQEPFVFSGDPLTYPAWKSTFTLLIDAQNISNTEKLLYLQKYVAGPAKEAISSSFLSATATAYQTALSTLDQRFGSPFIISSAIREKLDKWPPIKNRDGDALRKLSDFLSQCLSASQLVGQQGIFEDVQYQHRLMERLPDWMAQRWKRIYTGRRKNENRYPPFADFVGFISDEADIACEPGMNGKSSQKASTEPPRLPKTGSSYNTDVSSQVTQKDLEQIMNEMRQQHQQCLKEMKELLSKGAGSQQAFLRPAKKWPCNYCKGENHHITRCPELEKKPVGERHEAFRSQRLCFACGHSKNHIASACLRPAACEKCSGPHLSILHPEQSLSPKAPLLDEDETSVKQLHTASVGNSSCISVSQGETRRVPTEKSGNALICQPARTTMIVPVYVSSEEEPDKEIMTYALLDTQSYFTFVSEELSKKLHALCYDHCLKINTMTAESKTIPTKAVMNLRVRPLSSDAYLQLPTSYTTNFLSVDPQTIPTPEVARRHKHLKRIAKDLHPYDDSCIAGLLIGYDNPQALMPTEVIRGEPHAVRTFLGWTIIGDPNAREAVDFRRASPSLRTACALSVSAPMSTKKSPGVPFEPMRVGHVYRTRVEEVYPIDDDLVRRRRPWVAEPTHAPGNDKGAKSTSRLKCHVTNPLLLTPDHILTTKSSGVLPPPGVRKKKKKPYLKKHWKKTQHLVDRSWERWKRSCLVTLQTGRKKKPYLKKHWPKTQHLVDRSWERWKRSCLVTLQMGQKKMPYLKNQWKKRKLYIKKRRRNTQHRADRSCQRWRRSCLVSLKMRQKKKKKLHLKKRWKTRRKWRREQPNLAVGDVLLREDGVHRGDWKMTRVEAVFPGDDGPVRRCRLRVAKPTQVPGNARGARPTTMLERHVTKIILLVRGNEETAA